MSAGARHLAPYELDALALGGPEDARLERARSHLAGCLACQRAAAILRGHRERFDVELWPQAARRLEEAVAARPSRRWPRWSLAALIPAAVAASFALYAGLGARTPEIARIIGDESAAGAPVLLAKGEASLLVVARRNGRVFPAPSGTALGAGDQIRFVVESRALPYLLVASVDGAGKASVYFPFRGTASGSIAPGRRVELPGSVVLDAAPGPERVFALFSRTPLAAAPVLSALRSLAGGGATAIRTETRLPVLAGEQRTLLLEKLP